MTFSEAATKVIKQYQDANNSAYTRSFRRESEFSSGFRFTRDGFLIFANSCGDASPSADDIIATDWIID